MIKEKALAANTIAVRSSSQQEVEKTMKRQDIINKAKKHIAKRDFIYLSDSDEEVEPRLNIDEEFEMFEKFFSDFKPHFLTYSRCLLRISIY